MCERVAKAAIDYACDVLNVDPDATPNTWQSHYLCVIEDAIIHHIDWALETHATLSELEHVLKQFIDRLGQIFVTSQAQLPAKPQTIVH